MRPSSIGRFGFGVHTSRCLSVVYCIVFYRNSATKLNVGSCSRVCSILFSFIAISKCAVHTVRLVYHIYIQSASTHSATATATNEIICIDAATETAHSHTLSHHLVRATRVLFSCFFFHFLLYSAAVASLLRLLLIHTVCMCSNVNINLALVGYWLSRCQSHILFQSESRKHRTNESRFRICK